VFALLAAFTWFLLSRTVLGRHAYALGGNEQAARLSGIRTENVKWFAYCFSAVCASIAGLFYMFDVSVARPSNQAAGYELNAIAAAVVGGCALSGGVGRVPGVVLGALFLRVVVDAVSKIIKSGADVWEGMIVGIVVVLAVTFTQARDLLGSGRRFFPGLRGKVAIPTIAAFAALLAMSGTINSETFRQNSLGVGGSVFLLVLAILVVIERLETYRQNR
jgi:ribose/xylose/arabinose/galactoside ABC-type transport system permease subunit